MTSIIPQHPGVQCTTIAPEHPAQHPTAPRLLAFKTSRPTPWGVPGDHTCQQHFAVGISRAQELLYVQALIMHLSIIRGQRLCHLLLNCEEVLAWGCILWVDSLPCGKQGPSRPTSGPVVAPTSLLVIMNKVSKLNACRKQELPYERQIPSAYHWTLRNPGNSPDYVYSKRKLCCSVDVKFHGRR